MATIRAPEPPVLNIPNQLTAARFVLAMILFGLIAWGMWWWSLAVFVVAAFTDWLDGYLARKQGITSTLGRNLDPLVDKVLICGAYIFLLPVGMASKEPAEHWLAPWMVTVIVARELIITSLRSFMEMRGGHFGADWLGKVKMGLQCAALISIFLWMGLRDGVVPADAAEQMSAANVESLRKTILSLMGPEQAHLVAVARDGLIWAMLAATALSGLQYLFKAASLLKTDPEA